MASHKARLAAFLLKISIGVFFLPELAGLAQVLADQVEMRNGDRYVGSVSAVNGETVVLQSETLGTLRLQRSRVSKISFGPAVASSDTNAVSTPTPAVLGSAVKTNGATEVPAMFKQLAGNSNLVQHVQAQFLAGAGPEANAKFNELLNGLLSGKISVSDIRAQAQTAANQIREAKKELGDEGDLALDSYLAILDHFLKQTGPEEQGGASPKAAGASKGGDKAEAE